MLGVAVSVMRNTDAIILRIAAILSVTPEKLHTPNASMRSASAGLSPETQVMYRRAIDQADYAGT